MSEDAIAVEALSHRYSEQPVLKNVDLQVGSGRFASLVGPSGCGKSTVLRVLTGLLRPTAGTATVHGRSVIMNPGAVAYMPQRDALLPWRRALGNAVLGAEVAGVHTDVAEAKAKPLFDRFGLAGYEDAWPFQLSGGMRQRLALLRTFLMDRDVLLLDEPLGALDAITRRDMQQWLQRVWSEYQRTALLVTHDVEEALILSDVVFVMSPRPGTIAARLQVDLPRPRHASIVTEPAFNSLKAQVLTALSAAPVHPTG